VPRVAEYTGQKIDAIVRHFDEPELDLMLAEAKRLFRETRQMTENKGIGPGDCRRQESSRQLQGLHGC